MTIEKFDHEKAQAHLDSHEDAGVRVWSGSVWDFYGHGDNIEFDVWDEMRLCYLTDTPPEPSAFYDEASEITPEQWAAMSDFFDRRKRASKANQPISARDSGYTDVADLPDRTMLSSTPDFGSPEEQQQRLESLIEALCPLNRAGRTVSQLPTQTAGFRGLVVSVRWIWKNPLM